MRKHWRACSSLFRIRLLEGLQYRLAGLSSASIGIFWAVIELVVYTVFYTYGSPQAAASSAMTLPQVISYVWLGQAVVALMPMSIDAEIQTKIISGDVGIELCRPFDLYSLWMSRYAAGRLSGFLLRGGLMLLVGILIPAPYGLNAPASLAGLLLFFCSLVSAFLLCSAFGLLLCVLRLGVEWGDGPINMLAILGNVLSGAYLPLRLWPDALQPFLMLQPFAGYLDIPARLYTGVLLPGDALGPILLQLAWTVAFVLLGRGLMGRKLKNLIVQGG